MLFLLLVAVLVQACLPVHGGWACGSCPSYWTTYDNNCYRIFGHSLTWQEAESYCNQFYSNGNPAHLVSLHSREESEFVKKLWVTTTGYKVVEAVWRNMYWIGLNDIYYEGHLKYSDHTKYDFNNFHPGEPNNHGGNQDCIVVWDYQKYNKGYWDDQGCNSRHAFICKMRQNTGY